MSENLEATVRAEVRAWLEANWDPCLSLLEWRNMLAESGWGMPVWPREWWGRGLPPGMTPVVEDEFARINAVGVAKSGVRLLVAATILEHGTEAHKERFLKRILTGEDTWCQLFSEPGSGSDLAGLTTRAVFEGNQWTINGQKVWSTSAHHANWGVLLARTDWDQTKHKGLSYFILDMTQPGVEARPLQQMNGHASFNEVFFSDATIPPDMMMSERGNGWAVAMTTLMHERRLPTRSASGAPPFGEKAVSTMKRLKKQRPPWHLTPGIHNVQAGWIWCSTERRKLERSMILSSDRRSPNC